MKDFQSGQILIADELDKDKLLLLEARGCRGFSYEYIWVDRDAAALIVAHIKKVFEL